MGGNGPAAGTNGRKGGGALGEGTRGQEEEKDDDEQASKGKCQG